MRDSRARRTGTADQACAAHNQLGLVIGLAVLPLGIAAGAGLVLLTAGGAIAHLRTSDPVKAAAPAVVLGGLSLVYIWRQLASG